MSSTQWFEEVRGGSTSSEPSRTTEQRRLVCFSVAPSSADTIPHHGGSADTIPHHGGSVEAILCADRFLGMCYSYKLPYSGFISWEKIFADLLLCAKILFAKTVSFP